MGAQLNNPTSVAVDKSGNIYIADRSDNKIRMVNVQGNISTFAGTGSATYGGDGASALSASFAAPTSVAIDPGPEAALRYRAMLHTAFPDLRIKIEDIIAEGDHVAVRATWTGTHRGPPPLLPVAATNRAFTLTGMVFWRISDGQIVERWATMDRLGLQEQLTGKA